MDPRQKAHVCDTFQDESVERETIMDTIVSFGIPFLAWKCGASEESEKTTIRLKLETQFGKYYRSLFPFDDTESLSSSSLVGKEFLGHYWSAKEVSAEELSLVGQAWASVVASQADVERSFSTIGHVHRKGRARLLMDCVAAETFIRINIRLKKPQIVEAEELLLDDCQDEDSESESEGK